MEIVDVIVHLACILLSAFLMYWAGTRLNCLFYSAFEFSQASLIIRFLTVPQHALGVHHWLYSHFYTKLKSDLLLLYYLSIVFFFLQFFLRHTALYCLGSLYVLISIIVISYWYRCRVKCRDQRLHIPYNTFAPLHERQRRELNASRNRLQLSGFMQRWDLLHKTAAPPIMEDRQKTARKYQRY